RVQASAPPHHNSAVILSLICALLWPICYLVPPSPCRLVIGRRFQTGLGRSPHVVSSRRQSSGCLPAAWGCIERSGLASCAPVGGARSSVWSLARSGLLASLCFSEGVAQRPARAPQEPQTSPESMTHENERRAASRPTVVACCHPDHGAELW